MTTQQDTVTKYLSDHLAAVRHCKEALEGQLSASYMTESGAAGETVRDAHAALVSQIGDLERRLDELDARGAWKQAVTTVTGFLTSLYDLIRTERLSRALRDDYTAMSLLHISQTMMLTTATACGDVHTAELIRQHQRQLSPLITKIAERVPGAVMIDLERDGVPLTSREAPEIGVRAMRTSWQHASGGVA